MKENQSARSYDVIYEDEDLIVVNKPPYIRSVPGNNDSLDGKQKEWQAGNKRKRQDMWVEMLSKPGTTVFASNQHLMPYLEQLGGKTNVPRRKNKFISFVQRTLKVETSVSVQLWNVLNKKLQEEMGSETDNMLSRVQADFPDAKVVHRLDMETSGGLIFALNQQAAARIAQLFRDREIHKEYIAVVSGAMDVLDGEINFPLRADRENKPRQVVDLEIGKAALTSYKVIQQEKDQTRLLLVPKTGRTHQLRVHLASIGHPILGDSLYASLEDQKKSNRLLLHAHKLQIQMEPGKSIECVAPCPF